MHNFGHEVLRPVPPFSLIMTTGDIHLTTVRYAQEVEQFRKDVVHVDREMYWYPWFKRRVKNLRLNVTLPRNAAPTGFFDVALFIKANYKTRRVFIMEATDFTSLHPDIKTQFQLKPLGLLYEANSICQDMSQNTFQNRQIASLLSQAIAMQTRQDLDAQDTVDKALKVTELDSRCAGAWLRAARWAAKLSQPVAGAYAKRAIESDDSMRFDALLKLRPSDRHEAEQLLASWPQK